VMCARHESRQGRHMFQASAGKTGTCLKRAQARRARQAGRHGMHIFYEFNLLIRVKPKRGVHCRLPALRGQAACPDS